MVCKFSIFFGSSFIIQAKSHYFEKHNLFQLNKLEQIIQKQTDNIEEIYDVDAFNIEINVEKNINNVKKFEIPSYQWLDEMPKINELGCKTMLNSKQTKEIYHNRNTGLVSHNATYKKILENRNLNKVNKTTESSLATNIESNSMLITQYKEKKMIFKNRGITQKGLLTAIEEKKYGMLVQQLLKIQVVEHSLLDCEKRQPTSLELANIFDMEELTFIQFK